MSVELLKSFLPVEKSPLWYWNLFRYCRSWCALASSRNKRNKGLGVWSSDLFCDLFEIFTHMFAPFYVRRRVWLSIRELRLLCQHIRSLYGLHSLLASLRVYPFYPLRQVSKPRESRRCLRRKYILSLTLVSTLYDLLGWFIEGFFESCSFFENYLSTENFNGRITCRFVSRDFWIFRAVRKRSLFVGHNPTS